MRDRHERILERLSLMDEVPKLSVVSRIELEGGVYVQPQLSALRRSGMDVLLARHEFLDFNAACADAYRTIVERCGFSRPRTLDRMIAATAIVHNLTLITLNGDDFRTIPDLKLITW